MRNVNKKKILGLTILLIIALSIQSVVLYSIREAKYGKQVNEAYIHGQNIANAIELTLSDTLKVSEVLGDVYVHQGEKCFSDFDGIAKEIMAENPAIGSIYIAPRGIIEVAYPESVRESTIGFNALEDKDQGPRSKKAVLTRKITVAGPHELVEGGVGFIIRNPLYDEEKFLGFITIVLDWNIFVEEVLKNVAASSDAYNFAVWKESFDETAVCDEDGYIFRNTDEAVANEVDIEFEVPNDIWHLKIEPKGGFGVLRDMRGTIAISAMLSLFIAIVLVMIYSSTERKKIIEIEQAENALKSQYMEQLSEALERAKHADAAKTSFLFNMSHDIRTPMNAIIGFTNLLDKYQEEPERRRDYLRKIEDASSVLLSIINNVLEMARIEKGTIEIDESAWSAEQFNDTLYSVFHEMMEQKGLEFTRKISVEHNYVFCDPIKLREVFINILSNAYKYTNPGGKVHMALEELPAEKEGWVIYKTTISDTGIGMSEDFLPHLFEEFSRENNTTDNKIEGTGLGMPIVKRLVGLMDGKIQVTSEKGAGTVFVVTIPHRIADKNNLVERGGIEVDSKIFKGKRILLAEDNELNAEIALEILKGAGFLVDWAKDGQICVEMLEKAEKGYYDIILMDIQMPHMNGYEAAKTIRGMKDEDKAQIPILAMTANAFEEDKREALRVGMNGHVAKPINVKELMKALASLLG